MARRHRRPAVAIVFDLPVAVALERNATRSAPRPPPAALRRQAQWLAESALDTEGFDRVYRLTGTEEVDAARVEVMQS